MRISVDFPEPFGPRRPKISPRGTLSVTSSSARNLPKSFVTARTSMPFALSAPPRRALTPHVL
jgi:hypothetical protein